MMSSLNVRSTTNINQLNISLPLGGSVACWTQAQKDLGSNCSRDAVG